MTLNSLNSVTGLTTSDPDQPELDYGIDEGIAYAEFLRRNGVREGLVSDELSAAGWESPIIAAPEETAESYGTLSESDLGGSPVIFGN